MSFHGIRCESCHKWFNAVEAKLLNGAVRDAFVCPHCDFAQTGETKEENDQS